jgi:hypothetical protein
LLENQWCKREGSRIWCEDWQIIEILKYMFLGETTYFNEASPRRLRNNPLWSKDEIKKKAELLLEDFGGNVDELVNRIRSARNEPITAPR